MKLFLHRVSEEYLQEVRDWLSVENIKKNAIRIDVPFEKNGIKYDKLVRIDYLGIGATVLFDRGNNFTKDNAYNSVNNIIQLSDELSRDGYFIRFRLLLEYPFSVTAYSRIQAELSAERSSMEEPQYKRHFQIIEDVDNEAFKTSFYIHSQTVMLEQIESVMNDLFVKPEWNVDGPNKFTVRFVPFSPLMSCLFINNNLHYETYLLAKKTRYKKKLDHLSPIISLSKDSLESFKAFEDHFRYLWDLDVTLDLSDATNYKKNGYGKLAQIISPQKIMYNVKAKKILHKDKSLSERQALNWKSRMRLNLQKICCDPSPSPAFEKLFISCSWVECPDGSRSLNKNAKLLSDLLCDDFSLGDPSFPLISVSMVNAIPGTGLAGQLYFSLKESTIGLILMSKDIASSGNNAYYSRPNIYHELGYLMRHLGPDRLIIVTEEKVEIPSNVNDKVRIDFKTNKLFLAYPDIIFTICHISSFNLHTLRCIYEKYSEKLNKKLISREIDENEYRNAVSKIEENIGKFIDMTEV